MTMNYPQSVPLLSAPSVSSIFCVNVDGIRGSGKSIPYEELNLGLRVECSVTGAFCKISIGSKILGFNFILLCLCVRVVLLLLCLFL